MQDKLKYKKALNWMQEKILIEQSRDTTHEQSNKKEKKTQNVKI